MAEITAGMVKELREDRRADDECKKALTSAGRLASRRNFAREVGQQGHQAASQV